MNSHCLLYWTCIWQLWRHFSWLGRSHWTSQPPFLWFCDKSSSFLFFLQESKHLLQPLLSTVLSYIHSRSFWWPVFQSSPSVETETFGRDIKNGSGQWFLELPQQVCQSVPSAVYMRVCQSCCSSAGSHMALEGGCCLGRQLMQRGGCWGSLRFPLTSAKSHHCQWTTCLTHEGSAFCFFPKWVYTCSERKKPHFPLQHWELGEPPGLRGTQAWCSLLGIHFLLLL